MTNLAKPLFLFLTAIFLFAISPETSAIAQARVSPPPAKKTDQESKTQIYEIRHVDVLELMRESQVLGGREAKLQLFADEKTNRIFANGYLQDHERFAQIVKLLDIPDRATVTKIFRVPDRWERTISRMAGSSVELSMDTDNMMVAKGPAKSIERLKEIIASVEDAYSRPNESGLDIDSPVDVSVDLQCLFEKANEEESSIEAAVAKQLRELGFQPLTLVGSMHVATTVLPGPRPTSCSLAGAVDDAVLESEFELTRQLGFEGYLVEVELALSRHSEDGRIEAPSLRTTLRVPLNRWTIAGSVLAAFESSSEMPAPRCIFLVRVRPN